MQLSHAMVDAVMSSGWFGEHVCLIIGLDIYTYIGYLQNLQKM